MSLSCSVASLFCDMFRGDGPNCPVCRWRLSGAKKIQESVEAIAFYHLNGELDFQAVPIQAQYCRSEISKTKGLEYRLIVTNDFIRLYNVLYTVYMFS
jgi:hypothetical protein